MNWRVWFNRLSAVGWAVAGVVAFPLGWAYSVAFVTIASVYANVKTDWGTAEAADNREVLRGIRELKELMVSKVFEVDSAEGQRALLYLRSADGKDWICGAVLSELWPQGHASPQRPIVPDEQMQLVEFKVVIP